MVYEVIYRLKMCRKSVKKVFVDLGERMVFSVNKDLPCDADNLNAGFSKWKTTSVAGEYILVWVLKYFTS